MGFVPEDRGIFATLSVLENLTIGKPRGETMWSLPRIYELFPALKDRQHQRGSALSGGEQQMLAIARPLYMGASFLLLDEPTEGLAPVIIDAIGKVVEQLKRTGLTILLVEQNLLFATSVADRHYLLENGRIVRTMTNDEVIREKTTLLEHLGSSAPCRRACASPRRRGGLRYGPRCRAIRRTSAAPARSRRRAADPDPA